MEKDYKSFEIITTNKENLIKLLDEDYSNAYYWYANHRCWGWEVYTTYDLLYDTGNKKKDVLSVKEEDLEGLSTVISTLHLINATMEGEELYTAYDVKVYNID